MFGSVAVAAAVVLTAVHLGDRQSDLEPVTVETVRAAAAQADQMLRRVRAETPALRFGDPRVQALASALAHTVSAATGITNRSLRVQMPALLGVTGHGSAQASYDLTRLRLKGMITRLPGHNDQARVFAA